MKKITFTSLCFLASTSFYTNVAHAHGAKTVFSPYVSEGTTVVEAKAATAIDSHEHDGAYGGEVAVAHGVTSYWEVAAGVTFADIGRNEDFEAKSLVFENKFQLAPKGEYFVDPAIKIDYAYSVSAGTDRIGAKLILAKDIGKFTNIANFDAGRELGEKADNNTNYTFAYGVSHPLKDDMQIGLEWFSDFGTFDKDFDKQSHQIGPVVNGTINNFYYQVGVLAGVSDKAPDADMKLIVGYAF